MNIAMSCRQCHHKLFKKSQETANLWLELCRSFVELGGPFQFDERLAPWAISHLRELEKLGFILTTDDQASILVRVNGCDKEKIEDMWIYSFCLDRKSHIQLES
jgi:hypothetical protein